MKWVLILGGVVVALPLVLAAVGLLVPKGHVASRTAKFKQSPEVVWRAITNFEAFSAWRKGVAGMDRLPDRQGRPVWAEVGRTGRLTYAVVEFEPPRRMVTRIVDDKLPFGGSWTYEIIPEEGGCSLRITENGEIYNPIFRSMARFVFGYHSTMGSYLCSLTAHVVG